ncbi:MAG: hypothetical protein JW747_09400 [Candidatus Aminicenantes bacterium]|nr:hypothetical protein [Candidatus Aminicenantes bacterium]
MSSRFFLGLASLLFLASLAIGGQERAVIEGRVFDKETRSPLPAYISLPELGRGVSAGPDGRFRIALENRPTPGARVKVVAWLIGFKKIEVEALPGEPLSLALELEPLPAREIVVSADSGLGEDKPQAAVTLDRMDVYRMPGTAADPLYASHVLPGVNSPPDASSLLIRGGAPDETAYHFDGVEIIHPFLSQSLHESYFSIFDNQVVEDFNVSTSGFSPKFGDALSGVMDITAKDALFKGEGGLGLSVFGLNSYLGTPLAGGATLIGSLNFGRSELLSVLNGDDGQSFATGNSFGKLVIPVGRAHTVRLMGLYDRYRFSQEDGFRAGSENGFAALSLTSTPSSTFLARLLLSRTFYGASYRQEGVFDTTLSDRAWQGRLEAVLDLDRHFLEAGVDVMSRGQNVSWDAETEDDELVRAGRRAVYVSDKFRALDKLYVTAGLRLSSLSLGRPGWKTDPRVSLAYLLTKKDTLRISTGVHSQYGDHFTLAQDGSLRPRSAYHASLSYDRSTDDASLRLTAYGKEYRSLFLEDETGAGWNNGGRGFARGVEIFIKRRGRKFDVLGVYNSLSSKRMEGDVSVLAPSPYEISHSLTAIVTLKGSRSSLGVRYSYATGRPYTPLEERVWDETGEFYRPLWGEPYSSRYPSYRRCDINGTWNLTLGRRMVILYFGVTNLFNARNILRYEYSADYSVRNNSASIFGRSLFLGLYFPFF